MRYPVKQVGQLGVIQDAPDTELPPNAWSSGDNVRFFDGKVVKFKGHDDSAMSTPSVDPYWLHFIPGSTDYWLYASTAKVYVSTLGGTHTNITRASGDYSAVADTSWNGGVLGGVPILNNAVDAPQMGAANSPTTALQDLTWDASFTWGTVDTSGHTCRTMRPFRNYLVALNVTKAGTSFPRMVKWSDAADPNSVPASWDETDTTTDAGETELAQTAGHVIDGLTLRDTFYIYKEDSIWSMRFIGGRLVFSFAPTFLGEGVFTTRCVTEFQGKHACFLNGDIKVHDGSTIQSIVSSRMRRWVFDQMDGTNYARSFVAPNYIRREIWFCFPSSGATFPDTALVWNWEENSFGVRELPSAKHIAFGRVDTGDPQLWSTQTDAWAAKTAGWGADSLNPALQLPLIAGSTKLYVADTTNQFDGSNMTAYVERTGLDLGDSTRFKRVTRIWPRMEGNGAVSVYVGAQARPDDAVTWSGPFSFTPGTDEKIDCRVNGRYIGVRFESTGNVEWSLSGYDIEYREGSRY